MFNSVLMITSFISKCSTFLHGKIFEYNHKTINNAYSHIYRKVLDDAANIMCIYFLNEGIVQMMKNIFNN